MDDQDRARWLKLFADFETCELTLREFASERGVSFSDQCSWFYKLRKESRPRATESAEVPRQAPKAERPRNGWRLLPVEVVASAARPRTRMLVAGSGAGQRWRDSVPDNAGAQPAGARA